MNRQGHVKRLNRFLLFFIMVIITVGAFFGGSLYGALNVDKIVNETPTATNDGTFDKLFIVKDLLNGQYYEEIDQEALLEGAIKGMVNAVGDPYTVFYNQEEYQDFISDGDGNYVGIGVIVGIKDNKIVVISPFEGTPAFEAGIRAGDFIIAVEGIPYLGTELDKAVSVIKGNEGEPVSLTILSGGVEKEVSIIRRAITQVNVTKDMVTKDIGRVTMRQFTTGTAEQVEDALKDLKKQGAKSFILDLRGNPGGFLNEALDLGSLFIEDGKTVLYTLDKFDQKKDYRSKGGDYEDANLVVLIDQGSASASEVVAGALKDYGKATLVGQQSFGKGIVQQAYNVGESEGVKITVSSYFSPNGVNIHGEGITPDVEVALPEDVEQPLTIDNDTQLQKAVELLK